MLPCHFEWAKKYSTGMPQVNHVNMENETCDINDWNWNAWKDCIMLIAYCPYNGRHCSMNTHQWWWHILLRWSYFEFALTTQWWKRVHLMLLYDLFYFLDCHCKVTEGLLSKHPGAIPLVLWASIMYTSHFSHQKQFK